MKKFSLILLITIVIHLNGLAQQITNKDLVGVWKWTDSATKFPWYYKFDSDSLYSNLLSDSVRAVLKFRIVPPNLFISEMMDSGKMRMDTSILEVINRDSIILRMRFATERMSRLTYIK
jgi:hypothetical protein